MAPKSRSKPSPKKTTALSRRKVKTDHSIPGPVPLSVLEKSVLKRSAHEEQDIRDYVEMEAPDEKVLHLEKITTEQIYERRLVAWDVRTDRTRWWVITNPTNLYSQELFPSLDYTLSFHIGVTMRMMAHDRAGVSKQEEERLAVVWRHWKQATEDLDRADEAEDFQAVGMRCRECLIALARSLAKNMVPTRGATPPKGADFVGWSEVIADTIAHGSSADNVRSYLKSIDSIENKVSLRCAYLRVAQENEKAALCFVLWLTSLPPRHKMSPQ